MPATAPPCSIFLSLCPMADQVHLFNGVRYVPIKAIRDSDRKWCKCRFFGTWMVKEISFPPSSTNYPPFSPFFPIFPHFPPFFLSEREVEWVTEVPP